MDAPTAAEPLYIQCVSCGGSGCLHCDGRGDYRLIECPQTFIDHDVRVLVNTFGPLFEKGLPPVSGGVMDQSESFIAAYLSYQQEVARWKSKTFQE